MKTKTEIRKEIQRKLKNQNSKVRSQRSALIQTKLFRMRLFRRAKRVLVYVSTSHEVDTHGIIRKCLKWKKIVVVPKIHRSSNALTLRRIGEFHRDLKVGAFGILEPISKTTRLWRPKDLDCVILPGLAFDRSRNRLGRGKGYFDRLLVKLSPATRTIALAFPFQIFNRIPIDPHDRPVDFVVSS